MGTFFLVFNPPLHFLLKQCVVDLAGWVVVFLDYMLFCYLSVWFLFVSLPLLFSVFFKFFFFFLYITPDTL